MSYNPRSQHIILDVHRPENFNSKNRMERIISSARRFHGIFGLPIKMLSFPRTLKALENFQIDMTDVMITPLMGYSDYIRFQQESLFVYSDSGSAQEESALLGKPVIVPRDYTERPESVEASCSRMFEVEASDLQHQVEAAADWVKSHIPTFQGNVSWMGDGNTSQLVVDEIKRRLQ
jgi:UDP-N-acetylglucosamine 2-epimerase (non-hydrolysing)